MKTYQSTGYFQQAPVILMLCLVSSLVFAASAFAMTGNLIDACSDCHGTPYNPSDTAKYPGPADIRPSDSTYRNITTGAFVGSHRKHLTVTTTSPTVCTPCHGVPAPTNMSHRTGQLNFTSNIGSLNNSNPPGTYSKGRFFNQTSLPVLGTCSNVNCHSSPYGTTAVTTPTWGVVSGCVACHSGAGIITATGPATGSHPKHGTVTCINCHNAGTTYTSSPTVGHADGNIDVIVANYPANITKHPAGTYVGTCLTACHSATTTPVPTPTWASTLNCGSCHANPPASASHTKHLSGLAVSYAANATCGDCHNGAIVNSTGGLGHGNGLIDVSVGSYPTNRPKGSTYATCTTALCHSNTVSYKTATWGATNAAGCNFCHDALPTSGSHTIHVGGGSNYSFGCAECHGHNGAGALHNNGSIDIIAGIGYNGSKQCATSDCHSDGKVTATYKTSPVWGVPFAGDRCAGCHGNWPTGDAHIAHQVGIHYDDVATGNIGKIPASAVSTTNAGHGNATYSTTISCNMCHNLTVTVNYNDLATTCSTAVSCHASGATGGLKGTLTTASVNKTYHVNRVRDVSFAGATIRSKAQVRNDITLVTELNNFWTRTNSYKAGLSSHDASKATLLATATYASGTGTCSTVVCHNGNSITWTSGTITCDKCHTSLP